MVYPEKVVIGVKVALRTRSGRGQAGMCGSFGTIYSNIEDSDIDSVYTDRFWYRAKMTGIKLHGTIDVLIWGNRAYDAFIGAWLDWIIQGTPSAVICSTTTTILTFRGGDHCPYVVDDLFSICQFA